MKVAVAAAQTVNPPRAEGLAGSALTHISARGIAVDFEHDGRRQRVLQDVDLTVPKGSFVSLIGPSGCGKSTRLKVLAGLIRPAL